MPQPFDCCCCCRCCRTAAPPAAAPAAAVADTDAADVAAADAWFCPLIMQLAFMKVCIEEEHLRRWVAEKGKAGGGYAQAVLTRMREQWPELIALLVSDVHNKKAELFKSESIELEWLRDLGGRALEKAGRAAFHNMQGMRGKAWDDGGNGTGVLAVFAMVVGLGPAPRS